jgi:hypothetical protein
MDADQPPHQGSSLRLRVFWQGNTEAWFGIVKTRFRLKQVDDQMMRFDHVVNALPKECLRTVLDLVKDPPEDNPYDIIKDRLCSHHQLTDFERVEKLHAIGSLVGRKPSFLHEMLEMCPMGHEDGPFFLFLFLQRLPKELRIMLGDDEYDDMRTLAWKVDKLWSIHNHQQPGVVAAVEPSPPTEPPSATIAAVRGGSSASRARGRGRGGKSGRRPPPSAPTAVAASTSATPSPAQLARSSSGLCFYHWRYGDLATHCEGVCSWQGN